MEKIKQLIDNNRRLIIFLWGFFTLFLFYHFSVFRTIQSLSIPTKAEAALALSNLKEWNNDVGLTLTRKVKWGNYDTGDVDDYCHIKGWAFYEESKDILHDSLYLILESTSKQSWITHVYRFGTPDVVNYFGGNPELAQTGFHVSVEKKNLKNGVYRTGLLFRNQNTNSTSLFWTDYRIVVEKPTDPVLISRPSQKASELQFDIYDLEPIEENIRLACWAFPKTGICTSCKPYFTFNSPSSFYGSEAFTVPRPDVASYFKDSTLLNSGLQAMIRKNVLPKGYYKLGILLKDTLKKIEYFSESKMLINVGNDEFATPEIMSNAPEGLDTIRAFVDEILDKEDFIQVKGWAFINNVTTDSTEISLVLKSVNDTFSLVTTPERRVDIQTYFKLSYNVDWAGFIVKFKKESLEPDEYNVCILILNTKNNTKSLLCLDKVIKI